MGRIVAFSKWDELSPFQNGTNCRLFKMGRIVAFSKWDELSPFQNGTNCRLGRIDAQPLQFISFDNFSISDNVPSLTTFDQTDTTTLTLFLKNRFRRLQKKQRERPKSAPYLRLKSSEKTSKCQVFSSTVPEKPKSWTQLTR